AAVADQLDLPFLAGALDRLLRTFDRLRRADHHVDLRMRLEHVLRGLQTRGLRVAALDVGRELHVRRRRERFLDRGGASVVERQALEALEIRDVARILSSASLDPELPERLAVPHRRLADEDESRDRWLDRAV